MIGFLLNAEKCETHTDYRMYNNELYSKDRLIKEDPRTNLPNLGEERRAPLLDLELSVLRSQ
jgi:hypothetical protein